jgi:hypothetical protein
MVTAVVVAAFAAGCGSPGGGGPEPGVSTGPGSSGASPTVAPRVGEWGSPVDVDGRFTVTVSRPVDATAKFSCGDGTCGRTGEMDVTVTAGRDDVALSKAFVFTGVDDDLSEVGTTYIAQVGEVVLPAGKTHVERAVQVHYGDESKTNALTLWLVDPAGVKLVEWRLPG